MAMGAEAARRGIKVFVESSTGMVYKPDSTPRKETDKLKPWSKLAKWKLQAEEDHHPWAAEVAFQGSESPFGRH